MLHVEAAKQVIPGRNLKELLLHCQAVLGEQLIILIIIWKAILRSNGALSLANFRSGFYSTDHYHGNGPFVYFFCSREIQSRAKHKK